MPALPKLSHGTSQEARWSPRSYPWLFAIILLLCTSFFILRERWQIWSGAAEDVHYSALAIQSTISELIAQSSISLEGIRSDLENPASPSNNESLRFTREAMRFDPLSEYLGFRDIIGQRYFLMDRRGHLVNSAIGRDVATKLPSPTSNALQLYLPFQIPNDSRWYLPLALPVHDPHQEVDMVFALVPVDRLIQGASNLKTLEGSFLTLVNLQGQRLIRLNYPEGAQDIGGPPIRPELLADWLKKREGHFEGRSQMDQRKVLVGFSVSEAYPFLVIVGLPQSRLLERWARQSMAPALVLALALGILLWLGLRLRDTVEKLQAMLESQRHTASHDKLTGLLNRDAFIHEVNQWVQQHPGVRSCVMLLNLNRFKSINDTLGQQAGDELLVEVGQRLKDSLPDADALLARLGADEFAIFSAEVPAHAWLSRSNRQGVESLNRPINILGTELEFSASIGLACCPEDGQTSDELLRCADVAMHQAKADLLPVGRYVAAQDQFSPDMLELRSQFVRALRDGVLNLVYQAKVDLRSGRMMGVEALARWNHPVRGHIPPLTFIPLAENSDLIHGFTHFVLQTALRQARSWREEGHEIPVAVNLSVNNLIDQGFVERLQILLAVEKVPPQLLEFEVTESAVMRHPELALKALQTLRSQGVKLSIDDFGTGYASLAYLKQLPVQTLKIDRTFIDTLESDEANQRIVKSAIRLAHEFGMTVVAEGVEQQGAVELLRSYGCELAQGFYFSPPLAPDEFRQRWLHTRA